MASPAVGLDSGPPLPPGMSQGGGGLSTLAGQQSPDQQQQGGSLQESVISDFMLAEKALQSAAEKLPQFAPIADQLIQQLRASGGRVLAASAQPQGAPNPLATAISSIGNAPQT